MAPTIRAGTDEDVPLMVQQTWEVASEGRWIGTEVPFDRDLRADGLKHTIARPDGVLLVADASEEGGPPVVGHISVRIAPYGVADLAMMIVDGYRGRGVGSAMMAASVEWARTTTAHKMALEVWPHNEAAIALYRRYGFVQEGRKVRHYRRNNGELWDAILMGLLLDGRSG